MEGNPTNFAKLEENTQKMRPSVAKKWGAVCKEKGTVKFRLRGGVTSGDLSQASPSLQKDHWWHSSPKRAGEKGRKWTFDNRTVDVPCAPMDDYLALLPPADQLVPSIPGSAALRAPEGREGVERHVDFFSLDVEGAELLVLESLDFQKTLVDVFIVELDGHKVDRNIKVRRLLRANGFKVLVVFFMCVCFFC